MYLSVNDSNNCHPSNRNKEILGLGFDKQETRSNNKPINHYNKFGCNSNFRESACQKFSSNRNPTFKQLFSQTDFYRDGAPNIAHMTVKNDAFLDAEQVFRELDALFSEILSTGNPNSPVFIQGMNDLFTFYLTDEFVYTLVNFDDGRYRSRTIAGKADVIRLAGEEARRNPEFRYTLPPSSNLLNFRIIEDPGMLNGTRFKRFVQLYTDINHVLQDEEGNVFLQFGKNIQNLLEVNSGEFRSVRAELTNYKRILIEEGEEPEPPIVITPADELILQNTNQIILLGFSNSALHQKDVMYFLVASTVLIQPPADPNFVEIPIVKPVCEWSKDFSRYFVPPGTTSFFIRARKTTGNILRDFAGSGEILFESTPITPPSNGSSVSYLIDLQQNILAINNVATPFPPIPRLPCNNGNRNKSIARHCN